MADGREEFESNVYHRYFQNKNLKITGELYGLSVEQVDAIVKKCENNIKQKDEEYRKIMAFRQQNMFDKKY